MEITAETAIIGAGITGLCTAHAIHRGCTDEKTTAASESPSLCHVFESGPKVGGAIQTTIADGYLAEHGPNSILVKDKRVARLLYDIGLAEHQHGNEYLPARAEAKKRYIVHDGTPHAMPASPLGMLKTPLFSWSGKLRFALEPFIGKYKGRERGQGEESFANFVKRRLGPDMLASAAGPFVSGIYAGNPEQLSVRHAFPRLWNLEHRYGSFILGAIALQFGGGNNPHRHAPSEMISFRSGMHTLPDSIARQLPDGTVRLSSNITAIRQTDQGWLLDWSDASGQLHQHHYRNLVVTAPHHALPTLPLPHSVTSSLAPVMSLESPPVTSLVLGFRREDVNHPLDGFGMLIKQAEQSPLLGVLFSSSMFDGRAPDDHVTLTCMMGGAIHPGYADNDESVVLAELNRLLDVSGTPTFRHRIEWPRAIPQYGLNYQQAMDAMEDCERKHPGLHLAGNYRGGISVGDCIVNGLELGRNL